MSNRVWIYQSDNLLTDSESEYLLNKANEFCSIWNVHGKPLDASAKVIDNIFLALFVNEEVAQASGCSIDSSVQFIREAANHLNVDFFNRLNTVFIKDNKAHIVHSTELNNYFQKGTINEDTIFYNPLIQNDSEFETNWKVKLSNHWAFRMVSQNAPK